VEGMCCVKPFFIIFQLFSVWIVQLHSCTLVSSQIFSNKGSICSKK
jgi:hypothetical protein